MVKSINFPAKNFWINLILIVGVFNLIGVGILIFKNGFELILILPIFVGICSLPLFRSFSYFGYVMVNERTVTINHGLRKSMILRTDIKKIIRKERAYRIVLKNGKSKQIGLNFIQQDMKAHFDKKISEIETELAASVALDKME